MSRTLALAALVACAHSFVAAQAITPEDALKLNQIQVIGTHNSYHAGIAPSADQAAALASVRDVPERVKPGRKAA